jgi:hypothetical protein
VKPLGRWPATPRCRPKARWTVHPERREAPPEALDRGGGGFGFRTLEFVVQVTRSKHAPVHGTEDLDISDRIEAEPSLGPCRDNP